MTGCGIGIGCGLLLGFILHTLLTTKQPVINPRLLQTRTTALTLLALILHGFVFFAVTFYLPNFFQVVKGTSSLISGAEMVPYAVLGSISSIVCSVIVIRIGAYRAVLWGGLALMLVGQGLMCTLDDRSSRAKELVISSIAGLGTGTMFQVPLVAMQAAMPVSAIGTTTAAFTLSHTLAGALGITISGSILNGNFASQTKDLPGFPNDGVDQTLLNVHFLQELQPRSLAQAAIHQYAMAVRLVWIICAPLTAGALMCTLLIKGYSLRRGQRQETPATAEPSSSPITGESVMTNDAQNTGDRGIRDEIQLSRIDADKPYVRTATKMDDGDEAHTITASHFASTSTDP